MRGRELFNCQGGNSSSISRGVPDNARSRRYGVLDESHSGKFVPLNFKH